MDSTREAVAGTGLLVAAIRAMESTRDDRLFSDPFADKLAGDTGRALLAAAIAETGERSTVQIVVRTRFLDDALLRAARSAKQVVILAAGMDARAYRLAWPDGVTVYELDQPAVMAAGFDPAAPTAWLIEGLLQYLDEGEVRTLFDRVNGLSAPKSALVYDVVGKTLLESPMMAPLVAAMAEQGSPWLFGTDEPGELAERHGWSATVTDIAQPGNEWNRWFAPAVPMDVPGVPRGYFVEATRSSPPK